jgi:hypothetical protein
MVSEQGAYRTYLDNFIRRYPELFPADIERGYKLYGFKASPDHCEASVKMPGVRIRGICSFDQA